MSEPLRDDALRSAEDVHYPIDDPLDAWDGRCHCGAPAYPCFEVRLLREVRRLQAEVARYAGLEAVAAEAALLHTLPPESTRWLQALGRYGTACDAVWRGR